METECEFETRICMCSVHGQWNWVFLTYIHTYLLTPCNRVLLQKLSHFQLVKKFAAFYWTRKFITAVTSARHLSLSWAISNQSITTHPTPWRSVLILPSHLRLGLPSDLFPSGFPIKTLYTPLPSPIRAICPAHLILLDFITRTMLDEQYRSLSSLLGHKYTSNFRSATSQNHAVSNESEQQL